MDFLQTDGLHILNGPIKHWVDRRWRARWCEVRRLSPVADTLHLQLFKDVAGRGLQNKASLSLDHFRALETGFTLDKESNTLAVLCENSSVVLALDAREALIQWQVKICASVPYVEQYSGHLLSGSGAVSTGGLAVNSRSRSDTGVRLHVQDGRVSLVAGSGVPRLLHCWLLADLRRYGVVSGRVVLEAGVRCGRHSEGVFVVAVNSETAQNVAAALTAAGAAKLHSRRRKHQQQQSASSSHVLLRRQMSRSCSRDSSLSRSCCESRLLRQASIQWSTCSTEYADTEYSGGSGGSGSGIASGSMARAATTCDAQSDVSVGSDGAQSEFSQTSMSRAAVSSCMSPRVTRRLAPFSRSPCSTSDDSVADKISLCSLRRTGVLDCTDSTDAPGQRLPDSRSCAGNSVAASRTPGCYDTPRQFADHVYEEPRDRAISVHRADSATRRQTVVVAQVHVSAAPDYDQPPTARCVRDNTSPGTSDTQQQNSVHLYEEPGAAEDWYKQPRSLLPQCPAATARPNEAGSGSATYQSPPSRVLRVPDSAPLVSGAVCSRSMLATSLYSTVDRPAYAVVNKQPRVTVVDDLVPVASPPKSVNSQAQPPEPFYVNNCVRPVPGTNTDTNTDINLTGKPDEDSGRRYLAEKPASSVLVAGHYNSLDHGRRDKLLQHHDWRDGAPSASLQCTRSGAAPLLSQVRRCMSLERNSSINQQHQQQQQQQQQHSVDEQLSPPSHSISGVTGGRTAWSGSGRAGSVESGDSGVVSLENSACYPAATTSPSPPLAAQSIVAAGQNSSPGSTGEICGVRERGGGVKTCVINKPRSGRDYERLDRGKLLAQISH